MELMVKLRTARFLSRVLAIAILMPYLATGAFAAKAVTPARTVLVFPLDNLAGDASARVAEELGNYIKSGIDASGVYRVVSYSEELPGIDRIVRMQPEKKAVLAGPFYGDAAAVSNAVSVGRELSADLMLVGSLDKCEMSGSNVSQVVATVQLVDAQTGKNLKTVQVTGRAQKGGAGSSPTTAVQDAGHKIVDGLVGYNYQDTATAQENPIPKKHSTAASWLGVLAFSVGVGLLVGNSHSHHSGSSSGGSDNPPPSPF